MKKIFLGISLIAFVLFAFNAEATTIKQDKQKVAVEKKDAKAAEHKCCSDKKADAKCCSDKKTDKSKSDAKCSPSKDCSSKCSDKKTDTKTKK